VSSPPHPTPTLLARLLAGLLGLVLALALAEVAAGLAMRGAYPTLNLYEPDPTYGVRLTPNAETRVMSPSGRLTDIRTNALGFRGAEWPAEASGSGPVAGRVLVVGDSQVLGWGVAEEDGFVARLPGDVDPGAPDGARMEVLAAGVPTWGPIEYVRALAELVPRYRPERVVLVLNAANDWQEAPVPNLRRTTARDGWARVVLASEAPASNFPFRRWLLGRSHLVLGLRLLLDPPPPVELPSALATGFIADLPRHLAPDPPHRSRLTRHVVAARDPCARAGCELVPVLLPMDIQVHPSEWLKYRVPPRDARPTLALARALAADVPDLVDLTATLVAASPGAFLPDDYHLSPVGHAAVAAALAARLMGPRAPEETR
jgi:hypothetical protein